MECGKHRKAARDAYCLGAGCLENHRHRCLIKGGTTELVPLPAPREPPLQRPQLLGVFVAGLVVGGNGFGDGRERNACGSRIRISGGLGQLTGCGSVVQAHKATVDSASSIGLNGDINRNLLDDGLALFADNAEAVDVLGDDLDGGLRLPLTVASVVRHIQRNGAQIDEATTVMVMGRLNNVWDQLFPVERHRIANLMIERIDLVHAGEVQGIKVKWREVGWNALIAEFAPDSIGAELLEVEA